MPSKQVTDREKSSRSVATAATTHAAAVADAVRGELSAHLKPGETMPDVALLMKLLGRKITADSAALVAADKAHEVELQDDAMPRADRDGAAAKIREILVDLRGAVDVGYGPTGLNQLGLAGVTPSDPSVVATTADSVAEALVDAKRKLPKPRRPGHKIDRKAFADELSAELPALRKALVTVAEEDREKEATQRAKDQAMVRNDRTFAKAATVIETLAELGGLDDLAGKVKPSGRRPGRTAAEDEPTPPDGGTPS